MSCRDFLMGGRVDMLRVTTWSKRLIVGSGPPHWRQSQSYADTLFRSYPLVRHRRALPITGVTSTRTAHQGVTRIVTVAVFELSVPSLA